MRRPVGSAFGRGIVRRTARRAPGGVARSRCGAFLLLALPASLACAAGQPSGGPCTSIDCSSRGYCLTEGGEAYCGCLLGYHPVGLTCEALDPGDPCRGVACSDHGRCIVEDEAPACACEPGYHHPSGYVLLCVPDVRDGSSDVGPCVPTGAESCNGRDDDCDGTTDEDFDLDFDVSHCGHCGNRCAAGEHATPRCVLGECDVVCTAGWSNFDDNPLNGCEAVCEPEPSAPAETVCDGLDADCDGRTDEDWASPSSCGFGPCMRDALCWRGELRCRARTPPALADPTCDGVDDDCDGVVDDEAAGCAADADADADADSADITDIADIVDAEAEAEASLCGNGVLNPGEECEGSASDGCGECGTRYCTAATCTWGACDDPGYRCSSCPDGECYNRRTREDAGCGCMDGACYANCGLAGDEYDVDCGGGRSCWFRVESPGYLYDCGC